MLRVEFKDTTGKWHTYYVQGTSTRRTIKRERARLNKLGARFTYLAVARTS